LFLGILTQSLLALAVQEQTQKVALEAVEEIVLLPLDAA
jgi:hypothetical protein